jgi:hypothetical protein
MRIWLGLGFLLASTVGAHAVDGLVAVPEIDPGSGLAALAIIGSVGALVWERRSKSCS